VPPPAMTTFLTAPGAVSAFSIQPPSTEGRLNGVTPHLLAKGVKPDSGLTPFPGNGE
jgi:hypothetical protein